MRKDNFHPDHNEAPHRFRCWDGTIGCLQNKPETDFRFHKTICNSCVTATCSRFGISSSDFDMLALLIYSDDRLCVSALYLGASPDKVKALQRGQEIRLKQLLESLKSFGGSAKKVEDENMAYRKYFFQMAGIGHKAPKIADSALPVGDRK